MTNDGPYVCARKSYLRTYGMIDKGAACSMPCCREDSRSCDAGQPQAFRIERIGPSLRQEGAGNASKSPT